MEPSPNHGSSTRNATSTERKRGLGTIAKHGTRFRALIRIDGKQRHVGIYDTRDEALSALRSSSEALSRSAKGKPTASVEGAPGVLLRDWERTFRAERWADPHRRCNRQTDLLWDTRIDRHPISWRPLRSLTPRDVRDWVAEQVRTPTWKGTLPARKTVAAALITLRVCLQGALDEGLIDSNPAREVTVPNIPTTNDAWGWLDAREVELLVAYGNRELPRRPSRGPWAQTLNRTDACNWNSIVFCAFTGLRAGEAFSLRWTDVAEDLSSITVRTSWRRPTKGGRPRVVPLLRPAVDVLRRMKASPDGRSEFVFPGYRLRMRKRGNDASVTQLCRRAGIAKHVSHHDLRRTFATHCLLGTWGRRWSLEEVRDALGHASVAITEKYARTNPAFLQRAVHETRCDGF